MCDESSDVDNIYLTILVRLWDDELGKPVTRFLNMPVCNIGRGEVIFNYIAASLEERGLSWSTVVGLESDTANVMVGKHNSVLSRVKEKNPNIYSQGCVPPC